MMDKIDAYGGVVKTPSRDGWVQSKIAERALERKKDVDSRKDDRGRQRVCPLGEGAPTGEVFRLDPACRQRDLEIRECCARDATMGRSSANWCACRRPVRRTIAKIACLSRRLCARLRDGRQEIVERLKTTGVISRSPSDCDDHDQPQRPLAGSAFRRQARPRRPRRRSESDRAGAPAMPARR